MLVRFSLLLNEPSGLHLAQSLVLGEDALHFAGLGHSVHATDISVKMLRVLNDKVKAAGLGYMVTSEQCSFNKLENLRQAGPYDAVFSNFGGLNCTGRLHEVLQSLPALLKPGGTATLVIISRFCLWEFLLLFKGKFKTATRRLFAKNGADAHIEGKYFKCWYYGPGYVLKHTGNAFEALKIEGLCITVPPSYLEGFAEKYPQTYNWLQRAEKRLKSAWPWRNMGDYFIITLQKK